MMKLFAWEPFVHKRLGEVRKAEMSQIRFMRLLEIGINGVSELLPLVAKIVVFGLYVSYFSSILVELPHSFFCRRLS